MSFVGYPICPYTPNLTCVRCDTLVTTSVAAAFFVLGAITVVGAGLCAQPKSTAQRAHAWFCCKFKTREGLKNILSLKECNVLRPLHICFRYVLFVFLSFPLKPRHGRVENALLNAGGAQTAPQSKTQHLSSPGQSSSQTHPRPDGTSFRRRGQ